MSSFNHSAAPSFDVSRSASQVTLLTSNKTLPAKRTAKKARLTMTGASTTAPTNHTVCSSTDNNGEYSERANAEIPWRLVMNRVAHTPTVAAKCPVVELRKLSMGAMKKILLSYGVRESDIDHLRQYERRRWVRAFFAKAAASDERGGGVGLGRLATDEQTKLADPKDLDGLDSPSKSMPSSPVSSGPDGNVVVEDGVNFRDLGHFEDISSDDSSDDESL